MRKKVKLVARFSLPFLWMGIIFYFSSRQRIAVSENYLVSFVIFKTLHLIEYGILYLLWKLALFGKSYSTSAAITFSILYGIMDELHQSLVPTREPRIRDVFIDSLGVLIFWRFVYDRFYRYIISHKFLKEKILF